MHLKPVLGLTQTVFYSVGVIVGAGVYSVVGAAAGLAGQGLWLAFALGAGVALLTAFAYAEMATALPRAGAEYVYLSQAFPRHDWLPRAVGLVILAGGAATAATVAVAFGGYLTLFLPVPAPLSAALLLAACTALGLGGLGRAGRANIVFTLVEVAGLTMVVVAGLGEADFAVPLAVVAEGLPPEGVLAATALLFFVYLGFEEVANLAEEMHDPARTLPRALFISLALTTILYILVALATTALVDPAVLAASAAPLAEALAARWPGAGTWLAAIALFATANTVLITLLATTRLTFGMARDGELPRALAALVPRGHAPLGATLATGGAAVLLVPLGDVALLAGLSSFAALLSFLSVNTALIVLRFRRPDLARPFRVPFAVGRLPLVPVAGIAAILVLMLWFDREVHVAGALALGVALALGLLWRREP